MERDAAAIRDECMALQRKDSAARRHGGISGDAPGGGDRVGTWLASHTLGDILSARPSADRGGAPHVLPMAASASDAIERFRALGVHNLLVAVDGEARAWVCERDVLATVCGAGCSAGAYDTPLSSLVSSGQVHLHVAMQPVKPETDIATVLGGWARRAACDESACVLQCARHAFSAHHWLPPLLVEQRSTDAASVADPLVGANQTAIESGNDILKSEKGTYSTRDTPPDTEGISVVCQIAPPSAHEMTQTALEAHKIAREFDPSAKESDQSAKEIGTSATGLARLRVVTVADVLRYVMLHEKQLGAMLGAPVTAVRGMAVTPARTVGAAESACTALRRLLAPDNPTDVLGVVVGAALSGTLTLHTAASFVLAACASAPPYTSEGAGDRDDPGARAMSSAERMPVRAVLAAYGREAVPAGNASSSGGENALPHAVPLPTSGRGTATAAVPATVCTVGGALARVLRARAHYLWVVDEFGRPAVLLLLGHIVRYLHDASL